MAVARCEACGQPKDTKQSYRHPHVTTAVDAETRRILCGAMNCTRVAMLWLTDEEEEEYGHGRRSFTVLRHYQVRVT